MVKILSIFVAFLLENMNFIKREYVFESLFLDFRNVMWQH